ncbi:MAG: polysaccharide deacetylase family protein [Legionellaceae bacterium]|nr:polysaccharide deacetylase family protein [Legionellaceae bacterium]
MKKNTPCLILLICLMSPTCFAAEHEIAITIDDLPFVGTNSNDAGNLKRTHERFMRILDSLVENQVPATGFIIAGSIGKGQWELLNAFRKEGFGLGNHTYSHASLNRVSSTQYIDEIAHADKILQPVMTQPKYFRYPYLAEGNGSKKQEIQDYLSSNQYIIAPVTIDSKDYEYNERFLRISWRVRNQYLNQIKQQYLAYIWNQTLKSEKHSKDPNAKQILLIHANLLNSYCLGDIIQMYKKHGYRFISLSEALTNTAPSETMSEPKPELTTTSPLPISKNKSELTIKPSAIYESDDYYVKQEYSQNYSNAAILGER